MRKYETKMVESEVTNCIGIFCDLCGKQGVRDHWESGAYEINETELMVTVHQKEGESYPECGYGTEITVDMCPECFKNKLVPWINSQGGNVEHKDWSW